MFWQKCLYSVSTVGSIGSVTLLVAANHKFNVKSSHNLNQTLMPSDCSSSVMSQNSTGNRHSCGVRHSRHNRPWNLHILVFHRSKSDYLLWSDGQKNDVSILWTWPQSSTFQTPTCSGAVEGPSRNILIFLGVVWTICSRVLAFLQFLHPWPLTINVKM